MKQVQVKVFNAYIYDDEGREYYKQFDLGWRTKYDFHNQLVDENGYVWHDGIKIKPREQDIKVVTKYVLEDKEKQQIEDLEKTIKECQEKIRRLETEQFRFYRKTMKQLGYDNPEEFWLGTWDCNLSPFGQCVCHWDGNDETCIFCGEPEERK